MGKKIHVVFTLIVMLMFVFGDALLLFAEESKADEFTLEEITVTAQKRVENQQKVPIAMDVIANKDLAGEGKTNIDNILSGLANVAINTNSDGMRVSIRGLTDYEGSANGLKTSTPTVAVNIDGAQNDMASAGNNLFDVERVEVLYGPQSTMYASNSPGGIVNVVTAAPKTDRYSVNASYGAGNYKVQNFQTAVNVPIVTDKLAMRLSGSLSKQGSYVEGSSPSKNKAVRLKTLWDATDKLSFTLTGNLSKSNNGGMMGGSVKAFVHQSDVDDPWTSSGTDFQGANTADQITQGVNGNVSWDTSIGALTMTPNYSKSVSKGWVTRPPMGPGDAVTSYNDSNTVQKGAEVRMASPSDFTLFKWIAGLSYYNYVSSSLNTKASDDSGDSSSDVMQKNKAAFANITYPLWFYDKLSLTLGFRQSWDDVSHKDSMAPAGAGDESMSYSKPDTKYGFQWDIDDNMMLFGNYASSYRVDAMGTFTLYDSATKSLKSVKRPPEENHSYSLGLKSRMFEDTLQFNTTAFYYDYRNSFANDAMLQGTYTEAQITGNGAYPDLLTLGLNSGGAGGRGYITARTDGSYDVQEPNFHGWGDMRSIGLDTSIGWVASAKDMVNLSVSYLDSKWTKLNFDYMFFTIWTPRNCNGITAPNSSKWSITASYEHNFDLLDYGTLTPHIDMQHKTEYNLLFNTDAMVTINGASQKDPGYYYQEPYNIYNASLAFQHSSGKWNLNAAVKNITDYAVKKSYNVGGGPNATQSLMIGDPRTYSLVLSVMF
jgi:outer membrane receptor protein involved in Fe transport